MSRSENYNNRIRILIEKLDNLNKKSKWYVVSKLSLFTLALYFIYKWLNTSRDIWLLESIITIIAFVVVFIYDMRFLKVRTITKNLLRINNEELDSLTGNIEAFEDGKEFIDTNHKYSFDLDIFGNGSLFQSVNRTITFEGKEKLARWLQETNNSIGEITDRQQAIKELDLMVDFRQEYRANGIDKALNFTKLANTFEKSTYSHNPILLIFYAIVIGSTLLMALATAFGMFSYHFAVMLFIFQLLLVGSKIKLTTNRYQKLNGYYKTMSVYDVLLNVFKNHSQNMSSCRIKKLEQELITGQKSAKEAINNLKKLLGRFDQRNNVIIAILSNGFLLSDLFLNIRYEKWINHFHDHIEDYKNALGELDALLSLANFSYNNPNFCFPVVANDAILSSQELGHPLIDANSRVCNDYGIHSQSTYHLVTGANMAGKSTFLRTVGINLVLACNGAPVCAKTFRFKPITLFSSMRTSDNLVNHISYFQAELMRLKMLIDVAKTHKSTFIILDEILKGTNSIDKLSGSKLFLKKILEYPACGILATHDLALGEMENEMPDHFKTICFEIEIDGDTIKYDYKLQSGIAKNLNATHLLQNLLMKD